jgi:prolyl oligopeptidase
MQATLLRLLALVAIASACVAAMPDTQHASRPAYPQAMRGNVVDDYPGARIADPYRWLEDLDSAATRAWVKKESALTQRHLAGLPLRPELARRMGELADYERFGLPMRGGTRTFYTHNSGRQDQSVLYMVRSPGSPPVVALDPNTLSRDGSLAVVGYVPSHDGRLLAYGVSPGGSDWTEWRLRDVDSGRDLPDVLAHTKYYSPVFARDDRGLYYSAFPPPASGTELSAQDLGNAVYFHALGTLASADRKLLELPDHADWQYRVSLSSDGRWLVATTGEGEVGDKGVENVYLLDLASPARTLRVVAEGYHAGYEYIGADGGLLYFLTTLDAPNGRVVALDPGGHSGPATVVAEGKEPIALSEEACNVTLVNHQLFVNAIEGARSRVLVYDLKGRLLHEVALPGPGSAYGFGGEAGDTDTYYAYTSLVNPNTLYRYDARQGTSEVYRRPTLRFDPGQFEEQLVTYPAKDGTLIPLQLVGRRGLARDGHNPLLLYGYGGFGIPVLPYFNALRVAWLERGGMFAIANVRGGGEYGERWHRAANREHKQVVFDDFAAAAEWLIHERYTSAAQLAIRGESNGGLLVGASITQRPGLFGAAIAGVGVMDMLRFDKFGQGAGWTGEFGSPQVAADFAVLRAYSPLHNLHAGTRYPATLVITGDHDTRVMPAHSFKFAAALQAAQAGPAPVLLYLEESSGHGGGTTLSRAINQEADVYAFLAAQLGMSLHAPTQ